VGIFLLELLCDLNFALVRLDLFDLPASAFEGGVSVTQIQSQSLTR